MEIVLPTHAPYVSSEVSLFDTLVRQGEEVAQATLPVPLHLFLVDCLVEHLHDPAITRQVLALGFLESMHLSGEEGLLLLRRTGDAALLLAGFYPERALRLNVSRTYFEQMGQCSYASLAARLEARGKHERSTFYNDVSIHFKLLEEVLRAAKARPETEWEAYERFRTLLQ